MRSSARLIVWVTASSSAAPSTFCQRAGASSHEDPGRLLQGRRPAGAARTHRVRLPRLHLPTATGEEPVEAILISFLPAISTKAATAIRQTIRNWRMASTRINQRLEDLARLAIPVVRGWLNYWAVLSLAVRSGAPSRE